MSKDSELFDFFRTCPLLENLWSIAAVENIGVYVILPQGTSAEVQYVDSLDVLGNYKCEIVPFPSVYEDYQINCYVDYDVNDDQDPQRNINVLKLDEVQSICDWIKEQNENGNLPDITGEKVVSIECLPYRPQVRYVNEQEKLIAYFITVRIRYVNKAQRRSVEYEVED